MPLVAGHRPAASTADAATPPLLADGPPLDARVLPQRLHPTAPSPRRLPLCPAPSHQARRRVAARARVAGSPPAGCCAPPPCLRRPPAAAPACRLLLHKAAGALRASVQPNHRDRLTLWI
nr:protein transport protein SEC31-like [Aegilops tauschii subsp. strangulata]